MSETNAMDSQPIRNERILEAIEACRPGSDDVADPALAYLADQLAIDPELADLYERLQQVDGKLAAGFRDVPVPEGLEQRLLERLAAGGSSQGAPGEPEDLTEPAADEPAAAVLPKPKLLSRRWALLAGGMFASTTALLIAVWMGNRSVDYTPAKVERLAIEAFQADWADKDWPDGGEWGPSPEFRYVLPPPQVRKRSVRFLGRGAVAYDMMNLAGRPATLYVVDCTVAGLTRTSPPRNSSLSTGGYSTSAWMENGRLYVLVVDGDEQTYRGFLLLPDTPLT